MSVNCDVYVARAAGKPGLAFELKAAKPNSDQTKVSKEKLLKLHCMEPRRVKDAYYALPYSPYGSRERYDWWAAQRWFNMREDRCVLIGHELWDKLGGKGTYQSIIEVAESVGKRYKRRIYEEYLGRPPSSRPVVARAGPQPQSPLIAAGESRRSPGCVGRHRPIQERGWSHHERLVQGVLPRSANCVAGVAASLRHPAPLCCYARRTLGCLGGAPCP